MHDIILAAPHILTVGNIQNPLDGITPDFSVFGVEFNSLWKKLLGAVWALAIILAIVFMIQGIVAMGTASGPSANPALHAEGRKKALVAGISLGALAALGVIVGAILTIFQ